MRSLGKVLVAGGSGMVGSALVRKLQKANVSVLAPSRSEVDYTIEHKVHALLTKEKFDTIFIAAAKVGGIGANSSAQAEFLLQNLKIATNLIEGAFKTGVETVIFLGSSCIYPRNISRPIKETDLLTGSLEATNEGYAIAKIAGVKMCQYFYEKYGCDFRALMPCNLYGPGDNYHGFNSHVIPALIKKIHHAKRTDADSVCIWGSGQPLREFLYVEDLAEASIVMAVLEARHVESILPDGIRHVNVGSGEEITIRSLAELIKQLAHYDGYLTFDSTKPDGTPRKILDSSLIHSLGWASETSLVDGLGTTMNSYVEAEKYRWQQ